LSLVFNSFVLPGGGTSERKRVEKVPSRTCASCYHIQHPASPASRDRKSAFPSFCPSTVPLTGAVFRFSTSRPISPIVMLFKAVPLTLIVAGKVQNSLPPPLPPPPFTFSVADRQVKVDGALREFRAHPFSSAFPTILEVAVDQPEVGGSPF